MSEPMADRRLAEIRAHHATCVGDNVGRQHALSHRDDVCELAEEIDRLRKELADAAPYAEAGKQLAAKQAESEYYHGTCDSCSCCTTAQCREGRCPENSIGESTCPCTCY